MWFDDAPAQRIGLGRVREIADSGAETLAVSCPFCLIMLRDGTTDLGRTDVGVRDVAELLADATGAWQRDVGATAPPPIHSAPDQG